MNLKQYITEASKPMRKIEDMEEIVYSDGTVIKVQDMIDNWFLATTIIYTNYSFFNVALSRLVPIYTNSVKTMATDGIRIFINPHFMMTELSDMNALVFVIMHELMHCILNHIPRAKANNHNMRKSNIAGDYEINALLMLDGVCKKSTIDKIHALLDSKYYTTDPKASWPYEAIYNDNPKDPGQPNQSGDSQGEPGEGDDGEPGEGDGEGGQGQGGQGQGKQGQGKGGSQADQGKSDDNEEGEGQACGGRQDTQSANEAQDTEVPYGGAFIEPKIGRKIAEESGYSKGECGQDEDLTSKWKSIAESTAGQIGSGSGGATLNAVLQVFKPSKNWKSELRRYIGNAISKDEEEKMGRKSVLHNDTLKGYDRYLDNSLSKCLFMIDTSGSVSDKQLLKMISEAHHICHQKKVPQVTYAYYDDGVGSVETIKNYRKMPDVKKVSGRGGTSWAQAVADIETTYKRKKFELCVVFSDGDTLEEVSSKPKCFKNVVFVIIDRPAAKAPAYGKTIYINSADVK